MVKCLEDDLLYEVKKEKRFEASPNEYNSEAIRSSNRCMAISGPTRICPSIGDPFSPPPIRHSPTRDLRQPFSHGQGHVLYRYLHHNRKQMETLHNTNPAQNITEIAKRERLTLTLAGILIAIICSLVFLNDTHSMGRATTKLGLREGSKMVPASMHLEIKKSEVASALWLFK